MKKRSAFVALVAFCSAASASMVCSPEHIDTLVQFWQENDGKTVRRLPIDVLPENVFWWFTSRDFSDGMKTFNALVDEGLEQSTYNCVTLSLRCNPELGDPEVKEAAKAFFAKAHASGVKVYMDTDPRIARREFFSRWPDERQGIATVVTALPTNGVVEFSHVFRDAEDHMTSGAASTYFPISARVAAAFAARRGLDGSLDLSAGRHVEVEHDFSESKRRMQGEDGCGHVDRSSVTLNGKAFSFADDEVLVAVLVADYNSIDVFSPHLIPFERELMVRYKALGADGGMRDEWGFMPDYNPDLRTYWWSKNLASAYKLKTGRDILADYPLMALGAKGGQKRSEAIRSYMKLILDRNVEIERDFYDMDKKLFGEDAYVAKHPTWHSCVCPQEYWHNGLDWWQARRDWAQGDETTPIYVLNALAKKWGSPVWLNEGYTGTSEQNVFRVWTYAMCGGRQVYHCLYSGNPKEMERYANMSWEERRKRLSLDLLAAENATAQSRVRLPNLISRAPVDSPIAFVFGHEKLMDWSCDGWDDHGGRQMLSLLSQGWWCDAYPASEFALGTFAVDADGSVRVGRQRYAAVMLHNLNAEERRRFDAIAGRDGLKTRIFSGDESEAVCEHLQKIGAVRQPFVKNRTKAGPSYPEPDGTLRLIDGTAVRIRADWEHPCGLPINDEIESNGVKARVAAEGIVAVRCEGGEIVALAAGGLLRVEGPGLSIALESPEDVALMKIGGKWHGVWQTADMVGPLPAALSALTSHWIRLALPNGRKRIK